MFISLHVCHTTDRPTEALASLWPPWRVGSLSPSLARIAHAFLLPVPLPIRRLRGPFLETPLAPIVLLLFVYLSLIIYPLPVRGPVIGLWVQAYARVWQVRRRRWRAIT